MAVETVVWIYAFVLMIVHHFGEHLNDTPFAHQEKIASLSAGVTITYVFLQLLPEHHKGLDILGEWGSLTVLFGFSLIYLSEKYVYKHEKTAEEIRKDFKELHSAFLFLYYFAIGLLLHELFAGSVLDATLFFVPVLFHTAISSFSLMELDEAILDRPWVRNAITVAVLAGVATANIFGIHPMLFHMLLGVVTGMFLFVVIHDSMPQQRHGAPSYFVLGMVLYSAIMIYIWMLT